MAGKDRKKQLARQRYERQQARRAAEARRARRLQIIGAIAAVAVIAGGTAGIVKLAGGDDDAAANADAAPSTPPPEDGTPKQEITLQKVAVETAAGGGSARCKYPDSETDEDPPKNLGKPPAVAAYSGKVKATIKTNLGDIGLELDADKAPCATNSFAFLAGKKFFDKTKCHRLTTSDSLKVLQCGDPTGTGMSGPGWTSPDEPPTDLKKVGQPDPMTGSQPVIYPRGTVAIANSSQGGQNPNTGSSQLFIVIQDSELGPDYSIVGHVDEAGLPVLDKIYDGGINPGPAGSQPGDGKPKVDVTIETATVD